MVCRGEKLPCCLGVYVSLIDKSWIYNISSVIQFHVLSSEYLMMVPVLGPAIFRCTEDAEVERVRPGKVL